MPDALPDFLVVGALKAGTTYLDAMLRSHPGLSLPLHLKEVQYFDTHYRRGARWYANQFAPPDSRPRGEVSPQYLFAPGCAERIGAANPDVRLVLSVRQPVARVVSQYRHWVQETGYRQDLRQFLAEHPAAVERSRYWTLLQRYRAVFPDGQIHVIVFEDMVADPAATLDAVYRFLGVDPDHRPARLGEAVYSSGTPRFPRAWKLGKRVSRSLYAHGQGRVVELAKRAGTAAAVRARAVGSAAAPGAAGSAARATEAGAVPGRQQLPGDLAAELAGQLRADAAALGEHLGRDLLTLWRL